ncbi:hypothetical protein F5Y15DRAFT_373064 [Xylariaceae sp. FL0016]|nr:hypothetical protein F5Y15DRAFT_373064 [Xylariaceae sp. FL0016]
MAVASREVDPASFEDIGGFFNLYMCPKQLSEVRLTFRMISQLSVMLQAANDIVEDRESRGLGDRARLGNLPETPTERARKIRAILVWETYTNLFLRLDSRKDASAFLIHSRLWRWAYEFWQHFSPGEVVQVAQVSDTWLYHYLNGCICNVVVNLPLQFVGARQYERMPFFFRALSIWDLREIRRQGRSVETRTHLVNSKLQDFVQSTFSLGATWQHSLSRILRANGERLASVRRPTLESIDNVRFHADPTSVSDRIWNWSDHDVIRYFTPDNIQSRDPVISHIVSLAFSECQRLQDCLFLDEDTMEEYKHVIGSTILAQPWHRRTTMLAHLAQGQHRTPMPCVRPALWLYMNRG